MLRKMFSKLKSREESEEVVPDKAEALKEKQAKLRQEIRDYTRELWTAKKNGIPYYNRGSCYLELYEYHQALDDFNMAEKLNINDFDLYYLRGKCHFLLFNDDSVIQDMNAAIQLDQDKVMPYYYRGAALCGVDQYDQAIADLSIVIAKFPSNASAYDYRAISYYYRGNYDKAMEDICKAIELNPHDADFHNLRGAIYYKQGSFLKALDEFELALTIAVRQDYYSNLASVSFALGVPGKAIEYETLSIQANPDSQNYLNRVRYYLAQNCVPEAMADFAAAIECEPDGAVAYFERGLHHLKQQAYAAAVVDFTTAIQHAKRENDEYYTKRGRAHLGLGFLQDAASDFEKAISLKPDNSEAYTFLSRVYKKQHQWELSLFYKNKSTQTKKIVFFGEGDRLCMRLKTLEEEESAKEDRKLHKMSILA